MIWIILYYLLRIALGGEVKTPQTIEAKVELDEDLQRKTRPSLSKVSILLRNDLNEGTPK